MDSARHVFFESMIAIMQLPFTCEMLVVDPLDGSLQEAGEFCLGMYLSALKRMLRLCTQ